jgi:hypothetical protein
MARISLVVFGNKAAILLRCFLRGRRFHLPQSISPQGVLSEADKKGEVMQEHMTDPTNGARQPARRRLLGMGVLGGAALATGVLSAKPANAGLLDVLDRFLDLDPIVINFAYRMEELQCDFFTRAAYSKGFGQMSARERSAINLIAMQDREQFEALGAVRQKLGIKNYNHYDQPNASASPSPRNFTFGNAFNSRTDLLNTAIEIKGLAVASYHGAVNLIDRGNLTLAAAIAGTDGRHLSVLRELAGMDPVPSSFEEAKSPQETGRLLSKYGFTGGGIR